MTPEREPKSARLMAFKLYVPFLVAVIGASMLGLTPIFVRLADIGPNAIACYRMLFALPFLLLWKRAEAKANPASTVKPTGREWTMLAMAGFFFSLDLTALHMAIMQTSIINASIFNNLTPLFVPLLIWVFYAIRPSGLYMSSAVVAIIGTAILAGSAFHMESRNFQGDMMGILSAIAYSGYIILVKQLRLKFNTAVIIFWSSLSNLCFLVLITLATGESFALTTLNDWVGTLGLAIFVHVLGQSFLAYSMGQLSAAFVSVIMLLGPVVAAILGWVIYGEILAEVQIIGGIIVLSSILVASADERRLKRKMVEK